MAKKKPTTKRAKVKPPKPTKQSEALGAGVESEGDDATPDMDSTDEKKTALHARDFEIVALQTEIEGLKKEIVQRGHFPWDFPQCSGMIHRAIRTAPSSWHLRGFIEQMLMQLEWRCRSDAWEFNDDPLAKAERINSAYCELATVVRLFNTAPKRGNAPSWIIEAKKHPAFQKEWDRLKSTKGEHRKEHVSPVVLAVDYEEYQGDGTYKAAVDSAVFVGDFVFSLRTHGIAKDQLKQRLLNIKTPTEQITQEFLQNRVKVLGGVCLSVDANERVSSVEVLRRWTFGTLLAFDKHMDRVSGAPLSYKWGERWSDIEKYLRYFLEDARHEWKSEGEEAIQVYGYGLLPLNSGGPSSKPRHGFPARAVKRHAEQMIETWRRDLVSPVQKVVRE